MLRGAISLRSNSLLYRGKNVFEKLAATRSSRRLNSFQAFPEKVGLYDKNQEKDSCGVGLVAHLKKVASREIVLDANEMLVRMSHRGACGCEVNTGDGAGLSFTWLNVSLCYLYDIM